MGNRIHTSLIPNKDQSGEEGWHGSCSSCHSLSGC